jgi:hypothetical protein
MAAMAALTEPTGRGRKIITASLNNREKRRAYPRAARQHQGRIGAPASRLQGSRARQRPHKKRRIRGGTSETEAAAVFCWLISR